MKTIKGLSVAAAGVLWLTFSATAQNIASNFTLTDRETLQAYQLTDLEGHVIVLDFFAYWCGPCRASSPILETDVAQYYENRGGNQHGIPVRVIPVNMQANADALTDAFVADLGLSHAADDRAGSVWGSAWNQFGMGYIPHFVVINGVADASRYQPWEILYSDYGFPGAATLRQLIDSVDGSSVPVHADFVWNAIASPKVSGIPFPVTLEAQNEFGNTATSFTDTVTLSGHVGSTTSTNLTIGDGTGSWEYPMHTYYHDARTQVIYPASELGGACSITSLALDVTNPPGQTMENWTLRLKHSSLTEYPFSPEWEGSGWTVVYQGDEPAGTAGWRTFLFTVPFEYNGTDSLLVDFSLDNASWSSYGQCRSTAQAASRSIYYWTDSAYGSPLAWSGSTPPPSLSQNVPNLVLGTTLGSAVPVNLSPTTSGPFVEGIWAGTVTVHEAVSGIVLEAEDGGGTRGASNLFDTQAPGLDSDQDGLVDDWELGYFQCLTNVSFFSDWDRDGFRDGSECAAGTIPTDIDSNLRITSVSMNEAGTEAIVHWSSVSNKSYSVYADSDLTHGPGIVLQEHIHAMHSEAAYTARVDGMNTRCFGVGVEP